MIRHISMLLGLFLVVGRLAHAGDGFVLSLLVGSQPLDRVVADVERAHRLGATHFNIPMMLCQKNKNANEVFWCDADSLAALGTGEATQYKERILTLARELKARGFTTGVLPMILSQDDGAWRGFFEPTDFKAWGASYLERLREMADLAKAAGMSDFIAGTELCKLYVGKTPAEQDARNAYWRAVSTELHGRLGAGISVIIVANWDQFETIPFWDASDFVAVSAYYPLADSEKDDTSVEKLTARWAGWQARLLATADRHGKKLYFSEVGYASENHAAHEPWGWEGLIDLELQKRLYTAFGNAWAKSAASRKLERFMLWALDISEDPEHDLGFDVIGKPSEAVVSDALLRRLHPDTIDGRRPEVPVLFTIDDLPMWDVSDIQERVAAYDAVRDTLARHHVPGIAFANAGYISEGEWDHLRTWRDHGLVFANHTLHHKPRTGMSEAEFLAEVDSDEQALEAHAMAPAPYFRYPNLDYGPTDAERRATCEKIRARGYAIMPTSFDTRDWSWAEAYHNVAATQLAERPGQGLDAQTIAARNLADVESRFATVRGLGESAQVLMIHSTRFTRDYLENILTRLELEGARWVAPHDADHGAYAAGADCLPACKSTGQCY